MLEEAREHGENPCVQADDLHTLSHTCTATVDHKQWVTNFCGFPTGMFTRT